MQNRVAFSILIALASPVAAGPLSFGALNGSDDLTQGSAFASCSANQGTREQACGLTRTAFGGVPIEEGSAMLNAEGRVRSLRIALDARHHDLARDLLIGRYGRPAGQGEQTRWAGFDDGATITLARDRRHALITFDFPKNAAAPGAAGREGRSLAFLALFGAGAVATGLMLRRRSKPAPAPELSMRETLERRLREGRDLQV